MEKTKSLGLRWFLQNLHLLISTSIVVPTAIIYGFAPQTLISRFFDISVDTIDLANFLRAIMCLYLGVAGVWILGMWKTPYWKLATYLNILFMMTLAIGRLLSIVLDGLPTGGYLFGVIGELVLGIFGMYQLKQYGTAGLENVN